MHIRDDGKEPEVARRILHLLIQEKRVRGISVSWRKWRKGYSMELEGTLSQQFWLTVRQPG
jgi:hypothetical protein